METVELKGGQKLCLRSAQPEDAAQIIQFLNCIGGESDFLLFGAGECVISEEEERAYIQRTARTENALMLLGLVEDEIVSVSQVVPGGRARIAHTCEVSISVRKKFWGCGVGSAVMRQLIAFAQHAEGLRSMALGVNEANSRALSLYRKLGFVEYGRYPHFFCVDGTYFDEILMVRNV